jgi:hypothetical protein
MLADDRQAEWYCEIAITKFYDPSEDIGLGYDWMDVSNWLVNEGYSSAEILLGLPLQKKGNTFDLGKMGTYFQSSETVIKNRRAIDALLNEKVDLLSKINILLYMLDSAIATERGLYIWF